MSTSRTLLRPVPRRPHRWQCQWGARSSWAMRNNFNRFNNFRATHLTSTASIPTPPKARPYQTVAMYSVVALGTVYTWYWCFPTPPQLCDTPDHPKETELGAALSVYESALSYPSMKTIESVFANARSDFWDPETGIIAQDSFSLPASRSSEDHLTQIWVGEADTEHQRFSNGRVSFGIWGIFDGQGGGGHGAASILQALLPKNILYYLGLLANAESTPPASPNTSLLSMCSAHETDQAIRDAFLSLDRDMMNVATAAITGSRPLARSTIELGAADSASSALVALYDVRTRALRVACVGNSRAVLGRRTWSGRYKAIPLSVDQTGHNEDEVTRLRAEHPNEPDMIKDGRLLGSKITRAFGGLRWKLPVRLQALWSEELFGPPVVPYSISPPYLTAEPVITTTSISPERDDFLITASDGLWDHLSSEQAVELVHQWLQHNDPRSKPRPTIKFHELLFRADLAGPVDQDLYEENPPDCSVPGKWYKNMKYANEKNFVVVDENAAAHLVRNALGGKDQELLRGW